MANCKDCIHCKVCCQKHLHVVTGMDFVYRYKHNHIERVCKDFKDRSRFLELPCLPGDKVFLISSYAREIREYKVFSMCLMIAKNNHWFRINLENQRGAILVDYHFSDIGKTVFLTREEAEQALKEREKDE